MGSEVIGIGLGVAQQVGQGIFSQGQANQQYQNQQNLNLQNQQIQQQNWDYTNYENQRKHMEAAGLNVGMMYGMSGGGGATTGGGSGGSTTQATTPQSQDYMGMMLGAKQTESTIKLQEAQAEKLKVETEKIGGVDTVKTGAEAEGVGIDNKFKNANLQTAIESSKQQLANEQQRNEILKNEGKITRAEAENRDKALKAEIANKTMNTTLQEVQKKNTSQQTIESIERIKQRWEEISQNQQRLTIEQQRTQIQEFAEELKASYPNIWNVAGSIMNDGIGAIFEILGGDRQEKTQGFRVKNKNYVPIPQDNSK